MATTMGWNMDGEYVTLNESVEAPAEAQRRWARAGRQVTASRRAVDAMLGGRSVEDFVAQAAARRGLARQQPSKARSSLNTEGALAFSAMFVPSRACKAGSDALLMPVGSGNERLFLVDPSGQSPRRVAIEANGEKIWGFFRVAPCGRRVCCSVGLKEKSRIEMYQSDAEAPWPKLWSKLTGGDFAIDVDFSLDSAFVASVLDNADDVEIRDATTGALCKTLPIPGSKQASPLCCCCYIVRFSKDILVVKGGVETTHERSVCVWSLEDLDLRNTREDLAVAEPSQVLEFDFKVGPIALCEKPSCLVVSSLDGHVAMHDVMNGVVQPWPHPINVPDEALGTQVVATTFSHGGASLAVAWASGHVVVYDTFSTARIARFHQDDCSGMWDMTALAFSLDDCSLVMGGAQGATVSIHRVTPWRVGKYSIPGANRSDNLTSAAVSANFVALVAGTRVVVQRHTGEEVADVDTGEPIQSCLILRPVTLRPTEEDVAVALKNYSVASYKLETGALNWHNSNLGDYVCSIRYSPDGTLMAVASQNQVTVLGADSGLAMHRFTEQNGAFYACFDPTSTKLFVDAMFEGPCPYVIDLASGSKVHSFEQDASFTTCQGSFDEVGARLAYDLTDSTGASSIVVRVFGEPEKLTSLLKNEGGEDVQVPKGFCANWLLVAEFSLDPSNPSEITLVNCANNYEVATVLTELLPIVLGTGFTAHSSVGWVPGAATPTIHATVGSELVFVELEQFETTISDGCFPAKVLADLCGDGTPTSTTYQPEMISASQLAFLTA
jgi:WD40 repeat protein